MSAVRRPNFQRAYIREVAKQTTVMRLQGAWVHVAHLLPIFISAQASYSLER